jgi:hypothetical protein
MVLLLAGFCRITSKEPPLDRDVVRRIRRMADQTRREELLPFD